MNAAGSETFIETRSLTREYQVGPTTVRALDGIDLEVKRGEFLAVLGVSEPGKSTLLRLLGGLDSLTSGSVRVDNPDLATFPKPLLLRSRTHTPGTCGLLKNAEQHELPARG